MVLYSSTLQASWENASRLAVAYRAEAPSRLSISDPNRVWVSADVHQSSTSHARSGWVQEVKSIQAVPVEATEWSTVPSSCLVPGTTVKSHRPLISGADTIRLLYALRSAMPIGVSPRRKRLTKS